MVKNPASDAPRQSPHGARRRRRWTGSPMGDTEAHPWPADPGPDHATAATGTSDAATATTPAEDQLLARSFCLADISELRHTVFRYAVAAGLAGHLLDDFVLAINELVTNAVRHGGGAGLLCLWRANGELVCEVSDQGCGLADRSTGGYRRPPPSKVGGWGLWLARQLSDSMAVATGTSGTAVRISTALPAGRLGSAPSD